MPLIDFPIDVLTSSLRGAFGIERTSTGIVPVRLPDWAWREVPDGFTREIFRMPSGVRLALKTQATTVEIDIASTRLRLERLPDFDFDSLAVAIDLFVDGNEHAIRTIEQSGEDTLTLDGQLVVGREPETVTLRFDGLQAVDKVLELWLPTWGRLELRALRADAPVASAPEARPRWIHYGSSISHCVEALRPSDTWPAVAARLSGTELINLGVGGSCHLDQFVARTIRDTPAAFISLKIGINIAASESMRYRTFGPSMHGFLDTVRDGHPDTPILVVSPIICPMIEETPPPIAGGDSAETSPPPAGEDTGRLSLQRMREILAEVVATRSLDDPWLYYLDGLQLFGEQDTGELPDGVHPSPAGYISMGERFAEFAFGSSGFFSGAMASR